MAEPRRPRVAVVLGSGGIKPIASVTLFEFLEREGIEVDLLIGSSGGAILTSCRAAGLGSAEMLTVVRTMVNKKLFSRLHWPTVLGLPFGRYSGASGLINQRPLRALYGKLLGADRRFDQLSIPNVIMATDMETGDAIALEHGSVVDALCASTALPPFFAPVTIGGRALGDGGLSAILPVMEAVRRNVDVIIALSTEEQPAKAPRGVIQYLPYVIARSMAVIQRLHTALAISLHHHEIIVIRLLFDRAIAMWDEHEIPAILEAGRRAVEANAERIRTAVRTAGQLAAAAPLAPASRVRVEIGDVVAEIPPAVEAVARFGRAHDLPTDIVFNVSLALEEILSNIVAYAHGDDGRHAIAIDIALAGSALVVTVEDDGRPFDPMQAPAPDTTAPLEARPVGGLGIHLVKRLMDDVAYRRERDRNVVVLTKRVPARG